MAVLARFIVGGGFALVVSSAAFAGESPAPSPATPSPAAAEHERLMKETVCRNLDDDDVGSHVRRSKSCRTRAEWLAYDRAQKGGYDPETGRVVVKE